MDRAVKWIGGATGAVVLALGAAVFAGQSLEAQDTGTSTWLTSEDVLYADNGDTTTGAPAALAAPEPEVQPSPGALVQDNPFVIKRVLPISGPIKYGEWFWDDTGVPDGPLVITVDLDARVISAFRGGYEIGATAALLGTEEYPTPTGTFPILGKERHNVSEKYGNAPMPWTLRLTGDGVAIHGGHSVQNGYASHGCISVPDEFASRLFAIARTGDQVIITRGKSAAVGDALISG
ncbi:L,D-transpeptidase family protein [Altererythrobacter salegens]|uniref:L,D-transpeptidase family protein n=1 Tax=Croceibacterium salegens TaxID=1737568 RepID=A0A6I4T0D6_9SPHN|nr:L,D-transpeptidase family protein [Croceibacterium salegens]MXO60880.1 L,D-transpeptidase family protein [Croceibacterium salegens]